MVDAARRHEPPRGGLPPPTGGLPANDTAPRDPADIEDDRHDPERAHEIESRHDARHPAADPIIATRPRAPLTGWVWISALAALVAVLAVTIFASRFQL